MTRRIVLPVLLMAVALAAACGSREPLQITNIQLGRSLNSDDSVGNHTTTFRPDDTVYAAVLTGAAGRGTLGVRWVYNARTISEDSRQVAYTREAATAFRLQSPSGGFPDGDYTLEVTLDGEPAGTRNFRVAR